MNIVFYKKGVLRNFTKFTGKHLSQSLFFNKLQAQATAPGNISEQIFYRTPLVAASKSVKSFQSSNIYASKPVISIYASNNCVEN